MEAVLGLLNPENETAIMKISRMAQSLLALFGDASVSDLSVRWRQNRLQPKILREPHHSFYQYFFAPVRGLAIFFT